MKCPVKNTKFPKKADSRPIEKLTKYELIVLAQKATRALKRAEKRNHQLNEELNKTILDGDRDFERISADLDRAKQERKVFEVDQLQQRNTLLTLLAHAQMELQIAQTKNALLHQRYGVTLSITEEVKTLRVGKSSLVMGYLNHEFFRN